MELESLLILLAILIRSGNCDLSREKLTCMQRGQCQGHEIGGSPNLDLNACLELCHNSQDCNWWNYDPNDSFCAMLFNCTSIDSQTCSECLTGEKGCYSQDVDVLFVASGRNDEFGEETSVELIPLDSPYTVCPPVPDVHVHSFPQGFVHEGQPVVCGWGRCVLFNTTTWLWESFAYTAEYRENADGTALDNGAFIFLGGRTSSDTTEIFSAEHEAFSFGPEIPYDIWDQCATTFQGTQVHMTGGYNFDGQLNIASVLNTSSGTWSYLPPLNRARDFHACGIATAADGTSSLVIAGGYNSAYGFLSDSEILDLDPAAGSWRRGVDIPSGPIREACSLPYGNSFLVVGGTPNNLTPLSSIWQYDPDNSSMPWILRPEQLQVARQDWPVAVIVKASDLNCTYSANTDVYNQ